MVPFCFILQKPLKYAAANGISEIERWTFQVPIHSCWRQFYHRDYARYEHKKTRVLNNSGFVELAISWIDLEVEGRHSCSIVWIIWGLPGSAKSTAVTEFTHLATRKFNQGSSLVKLKRNLEHLLIWFPQSFFSPVSYRKILRPAQFM